MPLPTVFLSVQSDESRHIGNGHSMLMSMLKEPENYQLLERDMKYAFWQNHAIVDAAIGTFIEYGTTNRDKDKESYAEMWHRWIFEDYYRTYMLPLEKYGVKIHHDDVHEAWKRITDKMYVHTVAQFFAVGWPVNFWRIEAQTEKDFEWFEAKYPGWYAKFGDFWKWYAKLSHPARRSSPSTKKSDMLIRTVAGAAWFRASFAKTWSSIRSTANGIPLRMKTIAGQLLKPLPMSIRAGRRLPWAASAASGNGKRCITAWDLADAIVDLNFVRSDGKTLIPQPHLRFDDKDMWTLDDVRGHTLMSPLTILREMSPEDREQHLADYRAGFEINPCN